MTAKGALIGKGMTAEVYEWGTDRVLKLYAEWCRPEWIRGEREIGIAVQEAGVPAPEVYDTIEDDGRLGLVYERISGVTMLRAMQSSPYRIVQYALEMARLHHRIHRCSSANLPRQKANLEHAIRDSSGLLREKTDFLCELLVAYPEGVSVCHGDFHPDNIILSGGGSVAIDWTNANAGDPLCDAARTCVMLRSPFLPPGTPKAMTTVLGLAKKLLHRVYLSEYTKLAKVKPADVEKWLLPVAAARLRERVPGEEQWLLDMIDEKLRALKEKGVSATPFRKPSRLLRK